MAVEKLRAVSEVPCQSDYGTLGGQIRRCHSALDAVVEKANGWRQILIQAEEMSSFTCESLHDCIIELVANCLSLKSMVVQNDEELLRLADNVKDGHDSLTFIEDETNICVSSIRAELQARKDSAVVQNNVCES